MNQYTSSIIIKYGDVTRAQEDAKTLHDILSRQGDSLFIDVIAESVGNSVIKFKLNQQDVTFIINNLINELTQAIQERT